MTPCVWVAWEMPSPMTVTMSLQQTAHAPLRYGSLSLPLSLTRHTAATAALTGAPRRMSVHPKYASYIADTGAHMSRTPWQGFWFYCRTLTSRTCTHTLIQRHPLLVKCKPLCHSVSGRVVTPCQSPQRSGVGTARGYEGKEPRRLRDLCRLEWLSQHKAPRLQGPCPAGWQQPSNPRGRC